MKLNPLRMEEAAGKEEYAAGRELEEAGRVKAAEQSAARMKYTVAGQPPCTVTIEQDLTARCDCKTYETSGCCRHIVAAWLEAERAKVPESMLQKAAPKRASLPGFSPKERVLITGLSGLLLTSTSGA